LLSLSRIKINLDNDAGSIETSISTCFDIHLEMLEQATDYKILFVGKFYASFLYELHDRKYLN